jgi:hypothetical protein
MITYLKGKPGDDPPLVKKFLSELVRWLPRKRVMGGGLELKRGVLLLV